MKILRGTLTFVLGMIMGIVLFVGAIAGTLYAIAKSVTIGDLQQKIGAQITDEGHSVNNSSLWDVAMSLKDDAANIKNMSLNEIAEKYGVSTKLNGISEISGIDISPIFDVPISEITNSLGRIVDGITLTDIGELTGLNFTDYGIPVLQDNLNIGVTTALDNILKSIDSDNMSLRQIQDNFGISLGQHELFDKIMDAPLSSFGGLMNKLPVGTVIEASYDVFVLNGENEVYVKVDRYVEIPATEYDSVLSGAKTYISGVDGNGDLEYKELRFKQKTVVGEKGNTIEYVVDNSSNGAEFTADENTPTFYRLVEFERFDATNPAHTAAGLQYYVPSYANTFVLTNGAYAPKFDGYFPLSSLFEDSDLRHSLNGAVQIVGNTKNIIDISDSVYCADAEGNPVRISAYGLDAETYPFSDSRLIAGGNSAYLRAKIGTSDVAIQQIAHTPIDGLNNVTNELMNIELGELIDITDESTAILRALKHTRIADLSTAVDDCVLGDVIDISQSLFVQDTNGGYVFVPSVNDYELYDGAVHGGEQRYALSFASTPDGDYVRIGDSYYLYDSDVDAMQGLPRFQKVYTQNSDGEYVRVESVGYYTLYNPAVHTDEKRYARIMDRADAVTPDYVVATSDQIANTEITKYWFDTTSGSMTTSQIAGQIAYVKGNASALALQRLAGVSIGDFAAEFENMVLGDVMDIDTDVYILVATGYADMSLFDLTTDYYFFDDGVYLSADVFDESFRSTHPDEPIYRVLSEGEGNSVLKRLAFLPIDRLSEKMDTVIDDLALGEVISISADSFEEDADGKYVYVSDGKYYALFNAAVHAASLTRYTRVLTATGESVRVATDEEIAAGLGLYYFDQTQKIALPTQENEHQTLYVVNADVSSLTLQRFVNVKIGDFSSEFSSLTLSDVILLDGDVYQVADTDYILAHPQETYYVYDNGIYAEQVPASGSSDTYYYLTEKGETHAVLKKMSFLKVDELGTRIDEVINGLYLSDLIDINETDVVRPFESTDDENSALWLIEYDKDYTIVEGEDVYRYAFIYDPDGKYVLSDEVYIELSAEQLALFSNGTVTYGYTKITDLNDYTSRLLLDEDNIYYCNSLPGGSFEYIKNPALTAYLAITKNDFSHLYYRDNTSSGISSPTYNQYFYNGSPMLYIDLLGTYVAYDPTKLGHAPSTTAIENGSPVEMKYYLRLSDGYNMPTADHSEDDMYYFNGTEFVAGKPDGNAAFDIAFAKNSEKVGGTGLYYFVRATNNTPAQTVKFSKELCMEVHVENDTSKIGTLTDVNGVSLVDVDGERVAFLTGGETVNKMVLVSQKSAPLLVAFARDRVTISSLDSAIATLTIEDILDIAPDTMFDDISIRRATIDSLAIVMRDKLKSITIDDLIEWGNITTLDSQVRSIIGSISLENFLKALSLDMTSGLITIDMETLYGLA